MDRYDARGALHELSRHEAPPGGYDSRLELTKTEYDVEQLCDEERFRALHTDEDEELMYKGWYFIFFPSIKKIGDKVIQ